MQARFLTSAIVLFFGLLASTSTNAVIISIEPSNQISLLGELVTADIVFSELDVEVISAYDLDVTYDASILSATSVAFSSSLGNPFLFEVFEDFDLSVPGVVDLAQLSLLSDAALGLLQPSSFVTVATLSFQAIASGTSLLDFRFDAFNDVKGLSGEILPLTPRTGSVTVVSVPEPGTLALFLLGLSGLVGVRRMKSQGARR